MELKAMWVYRWETDAALFKEFEEGSRLSAGQDLASMLWGSVLNRHTYGHSGVQLTMERDLVVVGGRKSIRRTFAELGHKEIYAVPGQTLYLSHLSGEANLGRSVATVAHGVGQSLYALAATSAALGRNILTANAKRAQWQCSNQMTRNMPYGNCWTTIRLDRAASACRYRKLCRSAATASPR